MRRAIPYPGSGRGGARPRRKRCPVRSDGESFDPVVMVPARHGRAGLLPPPGRPLLRPRSRSRRPYERLRRQCQPGRVRAGTGSQSASTIDLAFLWASLPGDGAAVAEPESTLRRFHRRCNSIKLTQVMEAESLPSTDPKATLGLIAVDFAQKNSATRRIAKRVRQDKGLGSDVARLYRAVRRDTACPFLSPQSRPAHGPARP